MIDPYGQPPGHVALCGCDECFDVRQRWTDLQQPTSEPLDPRDGEDAD